MINKHIEIVRTSVVSLSSMSQKSCDAIFAVLKKHYAEVGITTVNNLADLEALVSKTPDLVFLGMNFIPINTVLGLINPGKIWLSEYLDKHNIAYTGSGQMAHQLEVSKPLAKERVLAAGLNTSNFYVAGQHQTVFAADVDLVYPLFVKPTCMGGGQGIDSDSIVYNFDQLSSKVGSIAEKFKTDSLIEEYLEGREFSVAILKQEQGEEYVAMPVELIAPLGSQGERILSGDIKSADTERCIAVTDEIILSQVTDLAMNVFHAIGARDYGRIDIRMNGLGIPQFLEANLIPSLIKGYGNFPKACLLNLGLGYEPMILQIAELGLKRSLNLDELVEPIPILSSLEPTLEPV